MRRINTKARVVAYLILCLLLVKASVNLALASTAAPGYAVTDFATGFTNPIGLAFDASGNLIVGDYVTGFLYKFGPAGGVASAATQLNATPFSLTIAGLAFTKDGRLYLNHQFTAFPNLGSGAVLEIDPSNGAVLRTVASIDAATGLAADPLSGDLFVSTVSFGGIMRISNFANGPGTVSLYANISADGLAFAADGTLYAAIPNGIAKIAGTNAATPGAVTLISATVPTIDGIAVSANLNTPFLYGNRNDGTITKVDLTTTPPTLTDIFTGGTRGDFTVVGLDGCLYATQIDRIVKVTNADGTCVPPPLGPLSPTNASLTFVASGSFVIGDLNAKPGATVTFWGAAWAQENSLSGGPGPRAFKGFANAAPQSCGGTWTSEPGNSSNPPATVPSYMAVIASSSVTKSGSVITGDVSKIVIVSSNPGYGPAVGHAGTGTVVAVVCGN